MSETINNELELFEVKRGGSKYRVTGIATKIDSKEHQKGSEFYSELHKDMRARIEQVIANTQTINEQIKVLENFEVKLHVNTLTASIDYGIIANIIEDGKNPTIKNYFMIERLIAEQKYWKSKSELNRALPHTMQYPVFTTILQLLEVENKIRINDDGSIIWTRASPQLMKELEKSIDA